MYSPAPSSSPLVGRDRELATLHACLASALAGRGSLVLIAGEAGIGKTALAEVLCREAAERGALVLVGRCFDLTETPPYGPWSDLFGRIQQMEGFLLPPAAFAERGVVGAVESQAALFTAVHEFFTTLAMHGPLLILLEDLHWADPASLDLLRVIARSASALPLLILVTYRADELTRRHSLYQLLPSLRREAAVHDLNVRRLGDDAVGRLVKERYALPAADIERLVTYLQARAEGNALFVGELLRSLEETGILRQDDTGYILGTLDQVGVPPALRQVIDARVSRLDEEAQRLLVIAAVIGQEVPLAVWVAVGETTEDAVLDVAEAALATRLLVELPGAEQLRFAHALIREALYEGIAGMRRRRIHRRVAETLAAARAPDPDAVAYHFLQAGDDRAAQWLVVAGTRARHANAFVTAIDRYERALALMKRDEAAHGERGWVAYLLAVLYYYTAPTKGIDLLTTVIGDAATAGDRTLEAIARFQRGLIRSDLNAPDAVDEMAAAVRVLDAQPPREIARIRHYLDPRYSPDDDRAAVARQLALVGRFAEATPLAERLVADGQNPLGQPYADGAWALGLCATARGEATTARHWFAQSHTAFRALGMEMALLSVIADEIVALLAFAADEPDALARLDAEAAQINAMARESGFTHYADVITLPLRIARGEWRDVEQRLLPVVGADDGLSYFAPGRFLSPIARHRGERAVVQRYIAAELPMGADTELGNAWFLSGMTMQRVSVGTALDAGDLPAAKAWLEAHDRWLAWAGAALGQSEGQALWAQYYWQAGDIEQAYLHAQRALAHATEPRQPLALLAAHRLLGELDSEAGHGDDAVPHLDAALALADACAARYERALTLLAMAELRATTGEDDAARALLAEVRTICGPLGAQPALARADALAANLTGDARPATAYPAGLTPREAEVLSHIAAGESNQEIADALFLSLRTVNRHIANLYRKIDARGRADATAFAFRNHLA